jgi:hypothetical protein
MTEQATPPAEPPKADPPDDDGPAWDRLGKLIDDKVSGALYRFFPPETEGAPKDGNAGNAGSGNGGEPPKRGTGGTGSAAPEAKPSQTGGDTPPTRKGGFLERLLYR